MEKEYEGYDIIGDVHGCGSELRELLEQLGYRMEGGSMHAPAGRQAIFLGDLVDRGPQVVDVVQLVMEMVSSGSARCILGNHELQLLQFLQGKRPTPEWGLAETLDQLNGAGPQLLHELVRFCESLPLMLRLDHDRLLVVHAGLPEELQPEGKLERLPEHDRAVRRFALYGGYLEDNYERCEWATKYRGQRTVVYGHTPTTHPQWVGDTLCIDTGCVYGDSLTALRYPERQLVSVQAHGEHYPRD